MIVFIKNAPDSAATESGAICKDMHIKHIKYYDVIIAYPFLMFNSKMSQKRMKNLVVF